MLHRLALLVSLAPGIAHAQLTTPGASPASRDEAAPSHGQVISISPLFAIFGFYTAEVERRIGTSATLGVGGSAFTLGPLGYRSLDAKVRFYPAERALEGFAVGLSAGKIWVSADEGGLFAARSLESGIAVGSEAMHTWLTGKRRNVALSIGGGLKRIVRYGGYDISAVQLTIPSVRANIGIAF